MFPVVGVFVAGVAGAVGAKIGTDVVYPWAKEKAVSLWESCKCVDCNCFVCECSEEEVDFNTASEKSEKKSKKSKK